VRGRVAAALGLLVALQGPLAAQGRAAPAARAATEAAATRRIVARQFARYPAMQPQDVYKLAFQAAMGSRHAGLDSAMAAEWLDREIASLGDGPPEPIRDTISSDGRMVRVNLRPYLAAGGSREALLRAFVRTAREFAGSLPRLRRELAEIERLAAAGEIPLAREALHAYFERMRAQRFPAVEHSSGYQSAYHPAYRVVLADLLPDGAAQGTP
jgi:hypothetical protein